MSRKRPWVSLGFILLLIPFLVLAQEWDANNFPNPTAGQFKECGMKTSASICDPDSILSESQRYRLNHELNQLEARTRQDHAGNFCEKKGVTGAMAVAKHFRGGSEQAVKAAANEMLRKWDLDRQCQKAVVIVLATEDRKFWVARGDRVPVYAGEFTELFEQQKSLFRDRNYEQGLLNILQGTWEKALSKQTGGVPSGSDGPGGSGGRKQPPPYDGGRGGSGGRDMPEFKMPKIPWGTIAAIAIIVIPILLCCCCIYCCCCKGKGGSNRRGDIEGGDQGGGMMGGGGGRPQGGGRGGGGGLGGFLGGMGGSAAMNGIMSLIRNRSGGGGRGGGGYPMDPMGGGGGYSGGGGYPGGGGSPTRHGDNPSGKGLYPSVAKADEGGGGSW